MRVRATVAAATAVLALTLVGCGSSGSSDDKPDTGGAAAGVTVTPDAADSSRSPEASGAADDGKGTDAALPAEPTGARRAAVLAVVFDVSPKAASDDDKAIDAARHQCAALASGVADPDHAAAQRFSYDGVTLTDDQGAHLNYGLRKTLCAKA